MAYYDEWGCRVDEWGTRVDEDVPTVGADPLDGSDGTEPEDLAVMESEAEYEEEDMMTEDVDEPATPTIMFLFDSDNSDLEFLDDDQWDFSDEDERIVASVMTNVGGPGKAWFEYRRRQKLRELRKQREARLQTLRRGGRPASQVPIVQPTISDGIPETHPILDAPQVVSGDEAERTIWWPKLGLYAWPDGYALVGMIRGNAERYDWYLYGHPSRKRFRSPAEFAPHLNWLRRAEPYVPCECRLCEGASLNDDQMRVLRERAAIAASLRYARESSTPSNEQPPVGDEPSSPPLTHQRFDSNGATAEPARDHSSLMSGVRRADAARQKENAPFRSMNTNTAVEEIDNQEDQIHQPRPDLMGSWLLPVTEEGTDITQKAEENGITARTVDGDSRYMNASTKRKSVDDFEETLERSFKLKYSTTDEMEESTEATAIHTEQPVEIVHTTTLNQSEVAFGEDTDSDDESYHYESDGSESDASSNDDDDNEGEANGGGTTLLSGLSEMRTSETVDESDESLEMNTPVNAVIEDDASEQVTASPEIESEPLPPRVGELVWVDTALLSTSLNPPLPLRWPGIVIDARTVTARWRNVDKKVGKRRWSGDGAWVVPLGIRPGLHGWSDMNEIEKRFSPCFVDLRAIAAFYTIRWRNVNFSSEVAKSHEADEKGATEHLPRDTATLFTCAMAEALDCVTTWEAWTDELDGEDEDVYTYPPDPREEEPSRMVLDDEWTTFSGMGLVGDQGHPRPTHGGKRLPASQVKQEQIRLVPALRIGPDIIAPGDVVHLYHPPMNQLIPFFVKGVIVSTVSSSAVLPLPHRRRPWVAGHLLHDQSETLYRADARRVVSRGERTVEFEVRSQIEKKCCRDLFG
ncbi:hypothetical protein HDU85_003377 [Gaertneriomyces sp. JEL0708]|nr:hypothetical protein HDU85_003377 [Gaertneriomyces sp. JEL0708]